VKELDTKRREDDGEEDLANVSKQRLLASSDFSDILNPRFQGPKEGDIRSSERHIDRVLSLKEVRLNKTLRLNIYLCV